MLRRKQAELLGRSVWEVFPELLNTPAEAQLRQAAAGGIVVKFELFLPGLYAWHEVWAVPSSL
ncbi:MAG: PAS domain-containing protein [Trichocoleus desertorum ATA4-8-CV12]|nr:PAS domain-containing protein [Trichocoleus desertorum ATA4-8-CV12]